jgi:hypothetical protein
MTTQPGAIGKPIGGLYTCIRCSSLSPYTKELLPSLLFLFHCATIALISAVEAQ